ncbi:MAG TPA: GNAT family N-acetyltransferase [Sedimentisphaerales bacterium]|nr:GNAT family N-acetyltransferase [Sedimentisphaerales bacterium]
MMKIRRMTMDDLSLGLRLTQQAGWNQIEADWRRFLSMEPDGCFVAEMDGSSVGTTTTCVFDGVAWIAMVLVEKSVRGRGIGTGLLKHAIDYLKERNVKTIRLDATPAGRPIYEKLGFVPEYELARYEGKPVIDRPSSLVPRPSVLVADITELDRRITGTNREKMLAKLFEEFPKLVRCVRRDNHVQGYVAGRPGANATQVGPCIATAGEGPSLLSHSLNRCMGKSVFLDVPLDNAGAVKTAEAAGLTVQRCFTRMCLGQRIKDDVQAIWASSGPEKG